MKIWPEECENVAREGCVCASGAVFTHSHIHTFNWEGRLRKVKTGQEEGEDRSFTHSHIHTFTHSHITTFTHSHIHTYTHSHIHTFTHSNWEGWLRKVKTGQEEDEDRSRGR